MPCAGRERRDAGVPGRPCSGGELVERVQEGSESLARSRGGGDEDMFSSGNLGPGLFLHVGGRPDFFLKPLRDQRVK